MLIHYGAIAMDIGDSFYDFSFVKESRRNIRITDSSSYVWFLLLAVFHFHHWDDFKSRAYLWIETSFSGEGWGHYSLKNTFKFKMVPFQNKETKLGWLLASFQRMTYLWWNNYKYHCCSTEIKCKFKAGTKYSLIKLSGF